MAANIELVTYEVTLFKGDEAKPITFSVYVDRDYYDDPKDAAIDHYTANIHGKDADLAGFLPKFKTLRILNARVPSDLGLGR